MRRNKWFYGIMAVWGTIAAAVLVTGIFKFLIDLDRSTDLKSIYLTNQVNMQAADQAEMIGSKADVTIAGRESGSVKLSMVTAAGAADVTEVAEVTGAAQATEADLGDSSADPTEAIWYKDAVVIWTYHHVEDVVDTNDNITSTLFREHMDYINRQNYHPISLAEYIDFLEGKAPVPPNAILITFDDGYESYYTNAFPILKEFGYPSVQFVIVGQVRNTGDPTPAGYTPKLTWSQMREMESTGLAAFGSHTFDLHRYKGLDESGKKTIPELIAPIYREEAKKLESILEYERRVWLDLTFSRIQLEEKLGHKVPYFAFPYGAYSEKAIKLAEETGFKYLFGFKPGVTMPDEWSGEPILRYNIGVRSMDLEALQRLMDKVHQELN